jgi:hypothetical protein
MRTFCLILLLLIAGCFLWQFGSSPDSLPINRWPNAATEDLEPVDEVWGVSEAGGILMRVEIHTFDKSYSYPPKCAVVFVGTDMKILEVKGSFPGLEWISSGEAPDYVKNHRSYIIRVKRTAWVKQQLLEQQKSGSNRIGVGFNDIDVIREVE